MLKSVVACILSLVAVTASAQTPCPSRLFVSGYVSTVHVFDACTGAYLRDLDTRARIQGAQAVVLGPDGFLYVVSEETSQILRYRNDTLDYAGVFATVPIGPTGLAFGPDRSLYVAGYDTDDVRRFAADGALLGTVVPARAAGLGGPDNGMRFGPDGRLYVPGYDTNNVVAYDPATGATTQVVAPRSGGLFQTRGLLSARDGASLFITGEGSGQVLRWTIATGAIVELAKLTKPTGIDYAPDGMLLVINGQGVEKVDPATGAKLGAFVAPSAGGIAFPTYLAVIPAGQGNIRLAIEYYHATLDHYFISALDADIAALDSGALKGWARTGRSFPVYAAATGGASPVCRFYLPPANGDSHFYSASPAECAEVKAKFPTFVYEASDVFHVALPDTTTGACPAGTTPVYRLWNARADSNHRYTIDATVRAEMLAKGYIPEGYGPLGVAMCAAG